MFASDWERMTTDTLSTTLGCGANPASCWQAASAPLRAPRRRRRAPAPQPRARLELPVGPCPERDDRPAATPGRDPLPDESARGVAIVDFYV